MKDKSVKTQAHRIHIGFDTEYDTDRSDQQQQPVSSQFFLLDYKIPKGITVEQLQKIAKRYESVLLYIEELEHGLGLVFDSRDWDAGKEYRIHFAKMLNFILAKLCKISSKSDYELHLWTLYSNAEIANLLPTLQDLRDCMREQGDTEKRSRKHLKPLPLQKSFYLANYKQGLPSNCVAFFRDVRHLFYKPSLEALGKQIGIEKLEHPDWEKVSASQWLESDPESFLKYGVRDAMIPCIAAVNFHKQRDLFIDDLTGKGLIESEEAQKIKDSLSVTTAGISDRLVKADWKLKGYWGKYKAIVEDMESNYLPPNAQRTKGGLNKFFLSDRPTNLKRQDIYDVKSQYATAMRMLKIPLKVPEYLPFPNQPLTAKEVAEKLTNEDVELALFYLDWELPEGGTEHERTVVAYSQDGDGCTMRKAEKQWIHIWELLTMAHVTPKALIRVHSCMVWKNLEEEGTDYATCAPYVETVTELRGKYKKQWNDSNKTDISAYLMSDTIKLIGNGTAGKFGQNKTGLDMENTHETLVKGGIVSNTANGAVFRANITYSLAFNMITAMARSFTSYSAWLNKAAMVVTDSMVVSHGSFKNPSEHLTEYEVLNQILKGFEFDHEYSGADILIFKERDYTVYQVKSEVEEFLESSIVYGRCMLEDSEFLVHKVAKRGWLPRKVSDTEVEIFKNGILEQNPNFSLPSGCNDWKTYLNNVEFFKKGFGRVLGMPLVFEKNLLLGAKEFLLGQGVLNSRQTTTASIGCHNLRFMCDDLHEFHRRKLVKEQCRRQGYADALHCKLEDPQLYAQIEKRCKPKPQTTAKLPQEIRKLIGVLACSGVSHFSCRALEKKFGISKTNVNRLSQEVKESKLDLKKYDLNKVLTQIEKWFEQ